MLWLHPAAWIGLVAVAAPLLIHLLVHRRSEPLVFPSLRFLQPTRFASIRRHTLDDLQLLFVRAAAIAAAVAALAAPLLTTAARRASWNARVARAIVVDPREPGREDRIELARKQSAGAFRSTIIEAADMASGLRRAAAWLDELALARREIVCIAPLPIGSVTASDVAALPAGIGLQFIRSGSLPTTGSIRGTVMANVESSAAGAAGAAGSPFHATLLQRTITLTGRHTSVRDEPSSSIAALPLDILAPADGRRFVDAAVAAALNERAILPAAGRAARLLIAGAAEEARVRAAAVAIRTPWIGDAVARLSADARVAYGGHNVPGPRAPASGTSAGIWQTVATDADGAPIVTAAQIDDRLLVASAAPAENVLTPVLIASMLDALSAPTDRPRAEIVPIAEAQLRSWERTPGLAPLPDSHRPLDGVNDDRRWLWGAVLGLLTIEWWLRRRSHRDTPAADRSAEEIDRVA